MSTKASRLSSKELKGPRDDKDINNGSDIIPVPVLAQTVAQKYLLVVAIDFGTTYSGYAFSFTHDYLKDPLKISTNSWNSGTLMSLKTPTVLYYDPRGKVILFGYEAEEKYLDVLQDKDKTAAKRCFYFSLFKMELYGHKKVSENMEISDISGKKMKALEVIKMSLVWLKDHLFSLLNTRGLQVEDKDIQWVLTVPAIWNDGAKQFMRLAGEAGIIFDISIDHCPYILPVNIKPDEVVTLTKGTPGPLFRLYNNTSIHDDLKIDVVLFPFPVLNKQTQTEWGMMGKWISLSFDVEELTSQAGMSPHRLVIALEPEAASVYCQHVPIEKHVFQDGAFYSELDTDARFMVADLGGGTADITVHQKLPNNCLRELLSASGGDHGGSVVNRAFLQFWTSVVGEKAMTEFKQNFTEDYVDVEREFEVTKRAAGTKGRMKETVKIPARLSQLCKKHNKKDIQQLVGEKYKDKVEVKTDKLRIAVEFFKTFFHPTIHGIVGLLQHNLSQREANGVNMVILVGGFAECTFVRDAIRDAMADRNVKVVVPEDPGLAVLKGAVIFGHKPRIIQSRITRFTYGISSAPFFDSRIHDRSKLFEIHGKHFCRDVFSSFMQKGRSVEFGHKVKKFASTVEPFQENLKFEVFASSSENPKYTTDSGCELLGRLTVNIYNLTMELQTVEVEYEFGQTQIIMTARVSGGEPSILTLKLEDK